MFSEDMAPRRMPRSGFGKDSVEVEGYVRGFARRRPDVGVTMLRCANLIGPRIETTLTRYFSLPVVPTVLGFDPRLQFCHEEDALAALHHATVADVHGTFNVAGDGVLMLSQAIRRLGRPSVALPPMRDGPLGAVFPPGSACRAVIASRPRSSPTAGASTPPGCASCSASTRRYTTAAAFDEFAAPAPTRRAQPASASRVSSTQVAGARRPGERGGAAWLTPR